MDYWNEEIGCLFSELEKRRERLCSSENSEIRPQIGELNHFQRLHNINIMDDGQLSSLAIHT